MFTPDGQWKEFGIGQSADKYTPFPFWMFCLTWAVVSYLIVLLFTRMNLPSMAKNNSLKVTNTIYPDQAELDVAYAANGKGENAVSLPKGYYVLNKRASKLAGTPKYVYIGENPPS